MVFCSFEAYDRLVEEPHLFVIDRPPQSIFDIGALMDSARHAGVVEAKAALSVRFRGVERQIRRLQEFARGRGVLRRRANADACRDDDLRVADFKRLRQFPTDSFGERLRLDPGETERLHDRELVAAEANDEVRGPRQRQQAVRDALEQHVAERMPVGVVDELEPIEVDDVQGEHALPSRQREKGVDMFAEMPAIGEVGQRIVARKIHDPRLRPVTPYGHRERRENRQYRGCQCAGIIAVSPSGPPRIVLFVRNGHEDLERGALNRPLHRHQTAWAAV